MEPPLSPPESEPVRGTEVPIAAKDPKTFTENPPHAAKLPWPFNHFGGEEWRLVKNAPGPTCIISLLAAVLGGLGVYFLFSVFILPGKNSTIETLTTINTASKETIEKQAARVRELDATNGNLVQELSAARNQLNSASNRIGLLESQKAHWEFVATNIPPTVSSVMVTHPIASAEDLERDLIIGKTVLISKIPAKVDRLAEIGPSVSQIYGKTFENCTLIGPAVIILGGRKSLADGCSVWTSEGRIESHLFLFQDRYAFGAVPFMDCGFLNCEFYDVGFAGTQTMLDRIKVGFKILK